jgi:hypothetical protein
MASIPPVEDGIEEWNSRDNSEEKTLSLSMDSANGATKMDEVTLEIANTLDPLEHTTSIATNSVAEEVDEDVVADVEENLDSRFIDFSLATPWEHLVAALEAAIKAWTRQKGKLCSVMV